MPLLVHGIEIRADSAEVLCALERAKATGDFLLDLGHANGVLTQIIRKRYAQIRHESQHRVSMLAQSIDEIECEGLLDPAATFVLPGGLRIVGVSFSQNRR